MRLRVVVVMAVVIGMGSWGLDLDGEPFAGATLPLAQAASSDSGAVAWALRDCDFVYATVQVPFANVAPFLSPGFEPIPLQGVVPTALVPIGVNMCRSGQLGQIVVPQAEYAQISIVVTPPEAYEIDGVSPFAYYHLFEVVIPDAERRAGLEALGIHTVPGDVAHVQTPYGGVRGTQVSWGDLGTVTIAGAGAWSPAGATGRFVDYVPTTDGRFAGFDVRYGVESQSIGAGTVSVPPGTWLADLLGAPVREARVSSGTWTYDPAHIFFREAVP